MSAPLDLASSLVSSSPVQALNFVPASAEETAALRLSGVTPSAAATSISVKPFSPVIAWAVAAVNPTAPV